MPEKYQRPGHHERVQSIERMRRALDVERDALDTVRRFNACLSAKGYAWAWPKISAAHPWVQILFESCATITDTWACE